MTAKQRTSTHRTSSRRGQLKLLSKKAVSDLAGDELGAEKLELLRKELNRSITVRTAMDRTLRALQPSKIVETLRSMQSAVEKLTLLMMKIWSYTGRYNAMAEGPSTYRESVEVFLGSIRANEFGGLLALLRQAEQPLSLISEAAALAEKLQLARRKGKQHPRSIDLPRYVFIGEVAEIYQRAFRRRATLTGTGHWCNFLAELLSLCERQEITTAGALKIWRDVKRESKREALFLWAAPRIVAGQEEFWKAVQATRAAVASDSERLRAS